MNAPGTSALEPDQQEWYHRFGQGRYLSVQEQPLRPSRRVRRASKSASRGVTNTDVRLFEAQKRALNQLHELQIRPV